MHGYSIAQWIEQRTRGDLQIVDVALYKSLHRLERNRAVEAEWGLSENNRRAKFYSLTPRGRQLLRAEAATWRRYANAVVRVLETT
jgi:DNA-binding PadR family transcriptional regulator